MNLIIYYKSINIENINIYIYNYKIYVSIIKKCILLYVSNLELCNIIAKIAIIYNVWRNWIITKIIIYNNY